MPDEPVGTQSQTVTEPIASPADTVPVARLNGALAKIQELTLQLQTANLTITQKDQEISRLSGDSLQQVATLKNDVAAREQQYLALQADIATAKKELAELQAYKRKVTAASKLQIPGIMDIIDVVPAGQNDAEQETILNRFGTFAQQVAQKREKELTAGNTGPVVTTPGGGTDPTSSEGWAQRVNSLPLGSPERQAAMEKWRKFTFKKE